MNQALEALRNNIIWESFEKSLGNAYFSCQNFLVIKSNLDLYKKRISLSNLFNCFFQ